jgi:hypothetical protein
VPRARPKPRGRPPVTGTTRSVAVLVRLEPAERKRLTEAARRAGLGIGPWLRSLGLREAAEP